MENHSGNTLDYLKESVDNLLIVKRVLEEAISHLKEVTLRLTSPVTPSETSQ